jgi:hypothetical protein
MDKYILDAAGEPMLVDDLLEWAAWFEKVDRRVDRTVIDGNCTVSTVFLGLDHNFAPVVDPLTYRPLLWETMIFGGPYDQEMRRYSSRAEALEGHRAMADKCRVGVRI